MKKKAILITSAIVVLAAIVLVGIHLYKKNTYVTDYVIIKVEGGKASFERLDDKQGSTFDEVLAGLKKGAAALAIDQDWSQKNPLCLYSDERHGIRAKLKVVDCPKDAKQGDLRQLMKRAMKEWLLRRQTVSVDLSDVSTEAILKFCDLLLQQTAENLREDPNDTQAKTVKAILTKIKNDYE